MKDQIPYSIFFYTPGEPFRISLYRLAFTLSVIAIPVAALTFGYWAEPVFEALGLR